MTSGYVTDYRAFRSESGSSDRYPRQESIRGIGGAVHARDHKPEAEWLLLRKIGQVHGIKLLLKRNIWNGGHDKVLGLIMECFRSLFIFFFALQRRVLATERSETLWSHFCFLFRSKNAFMSVGLFLGRSTIWSLYIGVPFFPHFGHFFD